MDAGSQCIANKSQRKRSREKEGKEIVKKRKEKKNSQTEEDNS